MQFCTWFSCGQACVPLLESYMSYIKKSKFMYKQARLFNLISRKYCKNSSKPGKSRYYSHKLCKSRSSNRILPPLLMKTSTAGPFPVIVEPGVGWSLSVLEDLRWFWMEDPPYMWNFLISWLYVSGHFAVPFCSLWSFQPSCKLTRLLNVPLTRVQTLCGILQDWPYRVNANSVGLEVCPSHSTRTVA